MINNMLKLNRNEIAQISGGINPLALTGRLAVGGILACHGISNYLCQSRCCKHTFTSIEISGLAALIPITAIALRRHTTQTQHSATIIKNIRHHEYSICNFGDAD